MYGPPDNAKSILTGKGPGEFKMLIGPSDMYGDLSLEDVDEFEGLEPEDGREVNPGDRFQRGEVRNFDEDFEHEMEDAEEEDYWQDRQEIDDMEDRPDYDDRLLEVLVRNWGSGKNL